MALAETARLVVDLSLKGNFARQLSKTSGALGKFDARLADTESRAFRAGTQIGTGIRRAAALGAVGVGLLAFQVGRGLESLVELEKQTAQTNAAIKSTGGVAGITATEVRALAEQFESMNATIGDETIQETENLLLTFTNIRKKAFKPTLQAILDINERLGRGPDGLAGTARQVGKALNDPVKGLAALTRIGITFDAATTDRIKNLQKQGKLFEAQELILKELNVRFGGSFLAGGGTTAGKVAKFHDAIEDLQRTLAAGMLPVVSNIADALSDLFADPAIQAGVETLGKDIAAFFTPARIKQGIGELKNLAAVIVPAFKTAASAIGLVIDAFSKLPPDLRNLLIGAFAVNKVTGGLLTNVAGGLAGAIGGALKTIYATHVTVIGPTTGTPLPTGGGGGGKGQLSKTGKILDAASKILLVGLVAEIADFIHSQIKAPPTIPASQLSWPFGPKNTPRILPEIFGNNGLLGGTGAGPGTQREGGPTSGLAKVVAAINAQPSKIADAILTERGGGKKAPGASTATENAIKELAGKLNRLPDNTGVIIPNAITDLRTSSLNSIDALGGKVSTSGIEVKGATQRGAQLMSSTTRSSVYANAAIVAGATRSSAGAIIAAIYAARPQINITQVTRNQTLVQRYGPGGTSATGMPGQSGV